MSIIHQVGQTPGPWQTSPVQIGGGWDKGFLPLGSNQPNQPSKGGTIVKHALIGGAIGAAAGFAASFLPFIPFAGPIMAAIGGVAGLVIGAVVGNKKANNDQARFGVGQLGMAPPAPFGGSQGLPPRLPVGF